MTQTATNDPWAAAAQGGNGTPDRAREMAALDPNADPFATPDSVGGGSGVRGPGWVDLLNRLVVLQPIRKLIDQPIQGDTNGKTQSFYVTSLTVLDGGPLEIVSPASDRNGKHYDEQRTTHDIPATFPEWYAYGAGITAKLDNLKLPLFLGVVKRCPTGQGYRQGETWEQATAKYEAWLNAMKVNPERAGSKPMFSWGLIDPSPEQRATALAWYRAK